MFATLIDYAVYFVVIAIYMTYFGKETNDGYQVTGFMALPIPLFWFFYFVLVEGIWQATLGHQLFLMKVCQENYDEINIRHSLKRRILDILDFSFFGIPAFVIINRNDKNQRIGDINAKTIVVLDEYEDE